MIIKMFPDEDKKEESGVNESSATESIPYNVIPFNFDKSYDFIENNLDSYGFCCDMFSAIVSYAEYALREKEKDNDEEAGLLMCAALTTAHLFSFTSGGQFYLAKDNIDKFDIEGQIVHYALKLAEEQYKGTSYEEYEFYQTLLDRCVSYYIRAKDEEDGEDQ